MFAEEITYKGVPISRGIAIGKAFFFNEEDFHALESAVADSEIDNEIARFHSAVEKSREDILRLQAKLKDECIDEGADILGAHLQIMQDPLITVAVEAEMRQTKKNAEFVFDSLIKKYQKKFQSIKDSFFRERFKDIQEISKRVEGYLRQSARISFADVPPGSIVIAEELTASDAAEAKSNEIGAIVTRSGGGTSHAAIVAKAKGIPYVVNVPVDARFYQQDVMVIVDGRTGEVIFNPSPETLNKYESLKEEGHKHLRRLEDRGALPAQTYDGYNIRLSINLEMVNELDPIHTHGSHGVGLFRSEYIFLAGGRFPSEEEQYEIYKKIVKRLNGLPIVIRTFDIGGDKQFQASANGSFLTVERSLRYFLSERQIFKTQLSAILRAAVYGEVSVMFPMVTALSDLLEAKQLLEEAKQELDERGIRRAERIRVGCMIEVPSAAIISDLLARECDFLSIGTNDLVQYSLAIDRGSAAAQKYYLPTHPSVIRLIKMVVSEGNHQGIPVSVCGEIASDPRFTPLLIGLGVQELSLASRFIPTIKNAVRNTSIVAASHLAEKVLSLSSAEQIMQLLTEEYRNNVPEDCFYNY